MGIGSGKVAFPVIPDGVASRRPRSATTKVEPISRAPSLTEAAASQLRELIVDGALPPGAALAETTLADTLRVSKTPVREALAMLKMEGLVTVVPHRGTFVFMPDADEVAPLFAHWATLASAALRFATDFDRPALLDTLHESERRLADAARNDDRRSFIRHEADLHASVFAQCGNSFLAEAYRLIAAKITTLRLASHGLDLPMSTVCEEVGAMVSELRANNVDAAVHRMNARIDRISLFVEESLVPDVLPETGKTSRTTPALFFMLGWDGLAEGQLAVLARELSIFLM